jgi:hypothetical protein
MTTDYRYIHTCLSYEYSMMLCINTPAPELLSNDAGRARAGKTNGESKVRCLEREGTVGFGEEEQRWRDGEQEGKGGVPRDVESRPRGTLTLTEHRQRRKGGTKIETIVLKKLCGGGRREGWRVGNENEKGRKFLVAVDGEGLGKEIGRVEEGAEIRKNKHALGYYPIMQPIPSQVHGLGLLLTECIIGQANSALIITKKRVGGWGYPRLRRIVRSSVRRPGRVINTPSLRVP